MAPASSGASASLARHARSGFVSRVSHPPRSSSPAVAASLGAGVPVALARECWSFLRLAVRLPVLSLLSSPGLCTSRLLSELQQDGLAHHMVGLVDRNGQDVGLDTQTTLLKVSRVNVIKPGLTEGVYDYAAYTERPVDALVPLEIIFRFGVPNGSSLMKCSMHALRGVFLAAGAGPKFRFSY